ncbi:MAG: prenyltransferase [Methanomassiliicoccales archaeon]|nr:prenyltransferase [Methanomassiliicoccales archaeon]
MNGPYSLSYKIKNVLRVAWTLPFVLSSITGVAFALTIRQEWLMAFVIPLDVLLLAMFVNLSNDYFDHKSGADKLRFKLLDQAFEEIVVKEKGGKSIYWQGNSFDRGLISDGAGKVILILLAIGAVVLSVPIVLYGGWIVLVLGAIAFFLSYFYTAPPLNLGARGLGELDVLASFTMISFFSFYVIAQQFSWPAVTVAVIVGIGAMVMRIVDEMSGKEAHIAAGEKDLVVRFGIDRVGNILIAILAVNYGLISILSYYNIAFVLLFLTLPFAISMIRHLRNKADKFREMRPVIDALRLSLVQSILVIISLSMQSALTFA